MLSKEDFIVLQHFIQEGLPRKAIAHRLGVSRKTVQRYADTRAQPVYCARPEKPRLIDPYRVYIKGRLEIFPELTAKRLYAEIKKDGYEGKYTRVKDYVRSIRPKAPIEIEQRFEVSPGYQAQVDFATFKTTFGTVYALLVVLSWSRDLWVRFFVHQDQLTVLSGLNQAFIAFGGVPKTVLFDRMKTAVARSEGDGKAVFNEEMLRFAAYYGFRPVACRPYRAKTKGKVERAVSYLRHDFFYGRSFRDLADLNTQLQEWLQSTANTRVHGTTGEVPSVRLEEERSYLLALPVSPYTPVVSVGRRMSRDGYVSYNGNDYSVPPGLLCPEVTVTASLEEVRLYQDNALVAVHPLLQGKGQRQRDPRHRPPVRIAERRNDDFELGSDIDVQHRPLAVYEEVLR
jgi:transposase